MTVNVEMKKVWK